MIRAGLILAVLLGVAHAQEPGQNPAGPETRPVRKGIDAAGLEKARLYHEAHGGQALVVLVSGKVVLERYANGGAPDRKQMLASGTKSFVGVAAAAAVEDGLIRLDAPAHEALEEWRDVPGKSAITLRQLLTLTSGLAPGQIGRQPAWTEILARPLVAEPGTRFLYGANQLNVFCLALQRRLEEERFEDYLKRRILAPLGIGLEWRMRCADGHPQAGGGANMTARDWATFGEFMRLGGKVGDEQVVAAEHLAECLRGTRANPAYGLTWWLKAPVSAELLRSQALLRREMGEILEASWLPDDLFLAAGAGKQRLYVISSLELVVARMAGLRGGRTFRDVEFLGLLLGSEPSEESGGEKARARV